MYAFLKDARRIVTLNMRVLTKAIYIFKKKFTSHFYKLFANGAPQHCFRDFSRKYSSLARLLWLIDRFDIFHR